MEDCVDTFVVPYETKVVTGECTVKKRKNRKTIRKSRIEFVTLCVDKT